MVFGVPSRLQSLTLGLALAGAVFAASPAFAISIELKDVAADRIERQRRAAQGKLPLPGTPDIARLDGRLAAAGLSAGTPLFVRVFKAESELEIWMLDNGVFRLFATYPICYWSGTLGPKVREGDRQAPEGFYTVSRPQLHQGRRWPRSLNIGYPNVFDRAQGRGGSYILVHGGCNSIGCFAMTNEVMAEVYSLTEAALREGQRHIAVHVFPFRMTDANLSEHKDKPWATFWQNLKAGYDAFELTRRPPSVEVCRDRYEFDPITAGGRAGPLRVCDPAIEAVDILDRGYRAAALKPLAWTKAGREAIEAKRRKLADWRASRVKALTRTWAAEARGQKHAGIEQSETEAYPCSRGLASCRKFIALKKRGSTKRVAKKSGKKIRTASRGRRA